MRVINRTLRATVADFILVGYTMRKIGVHLFVQNPTHPSFTVAINELKEFTPANNDLYF